MIDKFVDKFHPTSIDDVILVEDLKQYFKTSIEKNSLADMSLIGPPGIGKSTIADVIAKTMKATVLFIPCGLKGNIDTIRNEVKAFAEALDLENNLKIIILDEADQLSSSGDSSAQKALRSLMSDPTNKDIRWILTANYENKIIDPIKSRCPVIRLRFTAKDLVSRVIKILNTLDIKYTKTSVQSFVNNVIKNHYPDIRQILTLLQTSTVTGELTEVITDETSNEYDSFINSLFKTLQDNPDKPRKVMEYVERNKSIFAGNYSELACKILSIDSPLFTVKRVEKLAECIYRMGIVADPSVQFVGFICILLNTQYN